MLLKYLMYFLCSAVNKMCISEIYLHFSQCPNAFIFGFSGWVCPVEFWSWKTAVGPVGYGELGDLVNSILCSMALQTVNVG